MTCDLYFQCPDLAGIQGWHWEVAVTYSDILADVCVHGITSRIQKLALLGSNRDTREVEKLGTSARWPMRSAGLVDLAYFHSVVEVTDGGTCWFVVMGPMSPSKPDKFCLTNFSVSFG